MATTQREAEYQAVRSANFGKLTDGFEKEAIPRLETIACTLEKYNMHATIGNIIAIGERLTASRFDSFMSNNVQPMMESAEDLMKLSGEVASWLGMFSQSFTVMHSSRYKTLLAALKKRYALQVIIPASRPAPAPQPVLMPRDGRGEAHAVPHQTHESAAATAAQAAYVQLRGAPGFNHYKAWMSVPKQQ